MPFRTHQFGLGASTYSLAGLSGADATCVPSAAASAALSTPEVRRA